MGTDIVAAEHDPRRQGTEIVQSESEFFSELERRDKAFGRILTYAIAATHPTQWTDLGGKPWPTGPACEAMARRCRVSILDVESEKTAGYDERGDFYSWTYRARFVIGPNDEITAEGHCSSRDSFLGTGTGLGDDATRQPWEVEEGNIRQAAYTNMEVNGVCRLLGVRNVSWERLATILGVKREDFAKAGFKAGSRGGGQGQTSTDVELKFGKCKGKKLSEVGDEDVKYYVGAWEKDLADPEKEKYHRYSKRNIEIAQALLAARANKAAGSAPAASAAAEPSKWARIRAMAKEMPEADLKALVKDVTKKANASELTEEDLKLVATEIEKVHKSEDIKF